MTMDNNLTMRKIVHIDEDKCDGCGQCVPSCAEGAIEIIDGKARLVADNLCDGLGNCLGICPKDAIRVEQRPAEEFDMSAVESRTAADAPAAKTPRKRPPRSGRSRKSKPSNDVDPRNLPPG